MSAALYTYVRTCVCLVCLSFSFHSTTASLTVTSHATRHCLVLRGMEGAELRLTRPSVGRRVWVYAAYTWALLIFVRHTHTHTHTTHTHTQHHHTHHHTHYHTHSTTTPTAPLHPPPHPQHHLTHYHTHSTTSPTTTPTAPPPHPQHHHTHSTTTPTTTPTAPPHPQHHYTPNSLHVFSPCTSRSQRDVIRFTSENRHLSLDFLV